MPVTGELMRDELTPHYIHRAGVTNTASNFAAELQLHLHSNREFGIKHLSFSTFQLNLVYLSKVDKADRIICSLRTLRQNTKYIFRYLSTSS